MSINDSEMDRERNDGRAKLAAKVAGYQTTFRLTNCKSRETSKAKPISNGVDIATGASGRYHPRRSHKKSRMGCQNCKRRRVKCDERRVGGCLRCAQHAIDCDYLSDCDVDAVTPSSKRELVMSGTVTTNPGSPTLSNESLVICPSPPTVIGSINYEFPEKVVPLLQTLQHFELFTSSTIGSPAGQMIFKSSVLAIAQQEAFLMHAILGTAASHLASLTSKDLHPVQARRFEQTAAYHWNIALPTYRTQISQEASVRTMDALITTCMLIGVYFFRASNMECSESYVDVAAPQRQVSLLWLTPQKGFPQLLRRMDKFITSSVWMDVFNSADPEEDDASFVTSEMDERYILLLDLCGIDATSTPENNQYYSALQDLFALLRLDERSVTVFAQVVAFMGRVTSDFQNLLVARDKRASLILVYWLALMHKLDLWWTRNRAVSEGRAILDYLQHDHDVRVQWLLQWPRRVLGAG